MSNARPELIIAAAAALSAVLGSVHAFSVFIPQWEQLPGANRANVSLVYSLALMSLTIAVLFGYRLYRTVTPRTMFIAAGTLAAAGLAASAYATSLLWLYLGYGIVFGAANGLGYGYTLQLAGQSMPSRRGLAMSLITALYAVGATVSPVLLVYLIGVGGNKLALIGMSIIVLSVSLIAGIIMRLSHARFHSESAATQKPLSPVLVRARLLLWAGYGCAVSAGLIVIGHAYGIAQWFGLNTSAATWATTGVALGNMLGGFTAGLFADRISSKTLLHWLPIVTALGLLMLLVPIGTSQAVTISALGLIGYCYGAIIALYPVAISELFGALAAPRIYGQVFTAWGCAGLFGPWASGWLFDQTGSYTVALVIAVVLSAMSVAAIRYCLPDKYNWVEQSSQRP